jgi:hypothetical protein
MTDIPALGISYELKVSPNRCIVFQTHVSNDIDQIELNRLLDTIQSAASRQQAMVELIDAERNLINGRHQLRLHQRDLQMHRAVVDERNQRGGARKESVPEKQQGDNLRRTIEAQEHSIAMNEAIIEGYRALIVGEPIVPANGHLGE